VKLRPGGQVEVEFIAQTLQLIHARAAPWIASPTTRIAIKRLQRLGALSPADGALLIHADRVWRTVQGMVRITYGRAPVQTLSDTAAVALLRALSAAGLDVVDLPALGATLDALAAKVRAAFIRHVGAIEP
jgi:[glutamine synthetase] adenylyltransferase / [glutamine synthetase]-adenylyl-L-tyrosine phosphorylase